MIELHQNSLRVSFPEVHADAVLTIDFQRTLRIPDDGTTYPLPPGFGRFPLRHVDDFADRVPARWREHGGVMMPMYQAEALWIRFKSVSDYPFLVKIATGKINAVTGDRWRDEPTWKPQDYVVTPTQPWLDGYCVEDDEIRQFVAMPLGEGYSAEEQLTRHAEHGGLQILVHPLKRERWEANLESQDRYMLRVQSFSSPACMMSVDDPDMSLAPGGRMKQKIHEDQYGRDAWDLRHRSRCFVHIANSQAWRAITGDRPPTSPPTARTYSEAGLPWFDFYDDRTPSAPGSKTLRKLKSPAEMGTGQGKQPLPENESAKPQVVVPIKHRGNVVREGDF